MSKLQYFNGTEWETIEETNNPQLAWISLGGDTYNYRIIDSEGIVLRSDTNF